MAEDKGFYKQLAAIFEDEAKTCTKEAKKILRKHANKFRKNVENASPKRKGEYAKGWKSEVEHESEFDLSMVVRNTKKPTLPHLLEKAHIIKVREGKNGGYKIVTGKRKPPKGGDKSDAHPHILDNAERAIEDFYNELKKGGDS